MKERAKNIRKILILLVCVALVGSALLLPQDTNSAIKKPARVSLKSVKTTKAKDAKVTWKKVKCSAYQLQCSTDKEFKSGTKKIKLTKSKKTTTVKKLKKEKKYYFRIRAYRKGGKKIKYGKWSKIKSCTTHEHAYVQKSKIDGIKVYECKCGKRYAKGKAVSATAEAVEGQELPKTVKFYPNRPTKSQSPAYGISINSRGFIYNYKLFSQTADAQNPKTKKYPKGDLYLKKHGCSTCSLTTILRTTVPAFANYTPRQVLEKVIYKVAGKKVYKANFKKSLNSQMPISLKGISKVLKTYGVKHRFVYNYTKKGAAQEIRAHLQNGDPVIIMIAGGLYSNYPHTMLLLGLDKDGKVIVGESAQQKGRWGASAYGLIKFSKAGSPNSNTVENIVKYLKGSTTSVKGKGFFYSKGWQGNLGYILVNPTEE